jgi:tRNA(Ile)-lysidine synthase
MDLLKQVAEFVSRKELLSNGDAVLVGLSGGPDSVALLHLLTRLRRSYSLKLYAVYVNHGLRQKQALNEEKFCAEVCRRWHVGFHVIRADIPAVARKRKVGFEEAARDFRYEQFEKLADELGCARIAVGHQADDQVETVLFRIIRGTGRSGLVGIPAMRGKIIRPLLEVRRVDILSYLNRRRISYCRDSSNADLEYRRNYLRHKLIPEIRKRLNPKVDRAIVDLAKLMAEEEEFLAGMARRVYRRIVKSTPGGKLMLDLQIYLGYPLWLRRRVLRSALAELTDNRLSPEKEVIDRIDALAQKQTGSVTVGGGAQVEIARQQVILRGPARTVRPLEIRADNRWVRYNEPGIEFRAHAGVRRSKKIVKKKRAPQVILDLAKLTLPLWVRPVRPGDRFVPLGMTGQKKVGDYLTDRKVPVTRRDEAAVVCDRKGIIWLVGFEIADRVRIQDDTTEVMKIEYRDRQAPKSKTV